MYFTGTYGAGVQAFKDELKDQPAGAESTPFERPAPTDLFLAYDMLCMSFIRGDDIYVPSRIGRRNRLSLLLFKALDLFGLDESSIN